MQMNSTLNVLGSILVALVISGCAPKIIPNQQIEVKTVQIKPLPPIVPQVDSLKMRKLDWMVITKENYQSAVTDLQKAGKEPVIYGLSSDGYTNLMMNQNDVIGMIRQQQEIITTYRKSY